MRRVLTAAVLVLAVGSAGCIEFDPYASQRHDDVAGDQWSAGPAMGSSGSWVAFSSAATNLCSATLPCRWGPGPDDVLTEDTNGRADVFLKNPHTGEMRIASVVDGALPGTRQGDHHSGLELPDGAPTAPQVGVSGDGNVVAFRSLAANLVPGDTGGYRDVYVHDFTTGRTERASVSSAGQAVPADASLDALSDDGRLVAFRSAAAGYVADDTNFAVDVFLRDRATGTTVRASVPSTDLPGEANGASALARFSVDGRYLAFVSEASNLVVGDTNPQADAFVRDLQTGVNTLVSLGAGGALGLGKVEYVDVARDASWVVFVSTQAYDGAPNSRQLFSRELATGVTTWVSEPCVGCANPGFPVTANLALSDDGKTVLVATTFRLTSADTDTSYDIYSCRTRGTLLTGDPCEQIGTTGAGDHTAPAVDGSGGWYAYSSPYAQQTYDTNNARDVLFNLNTMLFGVPEEGRTLSGRG